MIKFFSFFNKIFWIEMKNKSMDYIEKLRKLWDLKTDAELALKLGITKTTLSSWKMQDNFDTDIIFNLFPEINPNWLIKNIGQPYLQQELNQNQLKISDLENELKKINAEIDETHADIGHIRTDIGQEISEIPSDTIKTIKELRQENKLLLEMIHNLSAKLLKG